MKPRVVGHGAPLVLFIFCLFCSDSFAACTTDPISGEDLNVLRSYVSYYGRPADPGGLDFWSGRLAETGTLSGIIQDFGTSQEFTDRYGELSDEELVTGIYQQLFARNPDPGGLAFYTGELASGARTLSTIALDVLFGAQNEDLLIVENRLLAAHHFTRTARTLSAVDSEFDGDAMAAVLALVGDDPTEAEVACDFYDLMLGALRSSAVLDALFTVSKTSDSDDGSCNSDCSLREAVRVANGIAGRARIQLPSGVLTLSLGQMEVRGDITIVGTTLISGAPGTSIFADDASRIFLLPVDAPDARLYLRKLILHGGEGEFGGSLFNQGSLVLDRVQVISSTALNGGAIFNGNRLALFGSQLSNNAAQSINSSTGFGGAIQNEGGVFGVFSSQLDGNTASFNGAGILSSGTGYFSDATLENNVAQAIGGAIDSTGPLVIVASAFSGNSANDGGAIALQTEQSSARIRNSRFSGNSATGVDLGGGGALFNFQGDLRVADSQFTANTALGEGGGAIETNGPLSVVRSTFTANVAQDHDASVLDLDTAPGFGGAILIIADNDASITESTFLENIGTNSGGAIYNDQRNQLTISGSTFTGNQAQGLYTLRPGGFGGAINTEGNLSVSSSSFSGNTAQESGGALGLKFGEVILTDSSFSGNQAQFGGAIVNFAQGANLVMTGGSISDNSATAFGGGIHTDFASQQQFTNVTVSGNVAGTNGGALYNSASSVTMFTGSSISGNSVQAAAGFGGGVHNDGSLTVTQSTVSGNIGGEGGGGLMNNQGGTLTLSESDVLNNSAANGAGLAAYTGTVQISDSIFRGNASTGFGGGILIDTASATITGTELRLNSARTGGGFSLNNPAGSANLTEVTIGENSVSLDAEAFFNFGSLSVGDSTIRGSCNNIGSFQDRGGNSIDCTP